MNLKNILPYYSTVEQQIVEYISHGLQEILIVFLGHVLDQILKVFDDKLNYFTANILLHGQIIIILDGMQGFGLVRGLSNEEVILKQKQNLLRFNNKKTEDFLLFFYLTL